MEGNVVSILATFSVESRDWSLKKGVVNKLLLISACYVTCKAALCCLNVLWREDGVCLPGTFATKACFFELGAKSRLDTQPAAASSLQTCSVGLAPTWERKVVEALLASRKGPLFLRLFTCPLMQTEKSERDMVFQPRGAWQLFKYLVSYSFIEIPVNIQHNNSFQCTIQ